MNTFRIVQEIKIFDHTAKCYMHEPESILENERHKFSRIFYSKNYSQKPLELCTTIDHHTYTYTKHHLYVPHTIIRNNNPHKHTHTHTHTQAHIKICTEF